MQSELIAAVDDGPRAFEVIRVAEHLALPFGRSEELDRERDARRATASADLQDIVATMSLRVEAHARPDVRVVCALDDDAGDAVLGCVDHLAGRLGTRLHVVRGTPPMPGCTPPAVRAAPVVLEEDLWRQECWQRLASSAAVPVVVVPSATAQAG